VPKATDDDYVAYVSARLPALKLLAYHLCGNEHRAEDLVQETITRVYMKWSRVAAADRMDQYVNSIMVRTHIDEARRGWLKVRLLDSPPEQRTEERPYEDRAIVHQALAGLPARQRAAVVLRYLYDLPIDEVAAILGCSTGTVKSQTNAAIGKLRSVLGDHRQPAATSSATGTRARGK
jgi:RNA polymerase sigma-70 factor (sigma-E family)